MPMEETKLLHDILKNLLDNVKDQSNSFVYELKPDAEKKHYVLKIDVISAKDIILLENTLNVFSNHVNGAMGYISGILNFYKSNPKHMI